MARSCRMALQTIWFSIYQKSCHISPRYEASRTWLWIILILVIRVIHYYPGRLSSREHLVALESHRIPRDSFNPGTSWESASAMDWAPKFVKLRGISFTWSSVYLNKVGILEEIGHMGNFEILPSPWNWQNVKPDNRRWIHTFGYASKLFYRE
jgi:hypothetical protein